MTDQYQPTSSEYLGPYRLNSIITGDAKELAKEIPDESIDLVFTDPIYSRIDDYRWLAETAARVLKPNSACLVFYGIGYLPETVAAVTPAPARRGVAGGRGLVYNCA